MKHIAEIKENSKKTVITLSPFKARKVDAQLEKMRQLLSSCYLMLWILIAWFIVAAVFAISLAQAEVLCGPQTGLYPFAVVNCEEYTWGVDTSKPLCEQPEWRHLSNYDYRCYQEVPFDVSKECSNWDCPVPYEKVMVEPITGTRKVFRASKEEIDFYYRSLRESRRRLKKRRR